MRIATAIAAAIFLVCCAGQKKPDQRIYPMNATVKIQLTDKQKIEELRHKAHALGLQWHIFCTDNLDCCSTDPNVHFEGVALSRGVEDDDYTDRWIVTGDTQANTAEALYVSIQGAPTHPAKARTVPPPNKPPKICPPELIGQ